MNSATALAQNPLLNRSRMLFLLRDVLPGFTGSSLLLFGSLGIGWLPLTSFLLDTPLVEFLRTHQAGLTLSRISVALGVVLLFVSWLTVGFRVLSGSELSLKRLWVLLTTWCCPLLIAIPLFSRDVFSYFAQGLLAANGFNPYIDGVASLPGWFKVGVDPMWSESPTPYGPFFVLIEQAISSSTADSPMAAVLLFRLTAVAGVVLLAIGVPQLARIHGIVPAKAFWLAVLNPLVLMHFVLAAHNDALMMGLILVGFLYVFADRPLVAIVCVTLAVAIKPTAIVVLPFIGVIWVGRYAPRKTKTWLAAFWAISLGACVAILGFLGAIIGTGFGWVSSLATPTSIHTWLAPTSAVGRALSITLEFFTGHPDTFIHRFIQIAGMLLAVMIIVALIFRATVSTAVRYSAWAIAALVVLSPVLHPWYLLWFIPLFAAAGMTRRWQLPAAYLLTAAFVIHTIAESSATADSFISQTNIAIIVLSSAIVLGIIFGHPISRGIASGRLYADAYQPGHFAHQDLSHLLAGSKTRPTSPTV